VGVAAGDFREQSFQFISGLFRLRFRGGEGLEVLFYQGRNGGIPPGGGDASQTIGVLIKGESDVFLGGM
jgi:hypothetical protein